MADRTDLSRRRGTEAARTGAPSGAVRAFVDAARTAAPASLPAAASPRAAGAAPAGRLVFALDATMSRQPTWDAACALQAELFAAAGAAGGLSVQLAYYRGQSEARASRWVDRPETLGSMMAPIACHGGLTQIGRILEHVEREAATRPVAALAFVGDAMEEEVDRLCDRAARLALRGTRAFMFLEGADAAAERAFREIARITGGAFLPFDRAAGAELRALLGAVGTYAAGGHAALRASGTRAARRLLADMDRTGSR